VAAEEVRAPAADKRRPLARVVAVCRILDLDHLRAHVAEQHRAQGAGQHAREVEHAKPGQRQWEFCGLRHRQREALLSRVLRPSRPAMVPEAGWTPRVYCIRPSSARSTRFTSPRTARVARETRKTHCRPASNAVLSPPPPR